MDTIRQNGLHIPNFVIICMEKVCSVFGYQYSVLVVMIVAVASYMLSLFNNKHFLAGIRIAFCKGGTGDTCPYNKDIYLHTARVFSIIDPILRAVRSQDVLFSISVYSLLNFCIGFITAL